ncbi:hypothetical protein RKD27_003576 [Streptomyces sp. SAI-126]
MVPPGDTAELCALPAGPNSAPDVGFGALWLSAHPDDEAVLVAELSAAWGHFEWFAQGTWYATSSSSRAPSGFMERYPAMVREIVADSVMKTPRGLKVLSEWSAVHPGSAEIHDFTFRPGNRRATGVRCRWAWWGGLCWQWKPRETSRWSLRISRPPGSTLRDARVRNARVWFLLTIILGADASSWPRRVNWCRWHENCHKHCGGLLKSPGRKSFALEVGRHSDGVRGLLVSGARAAAQEFVEQYARDGTLSAHSLEKAEFGV